MSPIPDLNALSPQKRALLLKRLAEKGLSGLPDSQVRGRGDQSPVPLSFLQEGLWFIDQLDPGKPTYNVPMTARLRGPLDLGILEQALQQIYDRHESLRTTFQNVDGELRQVIGPPDAFLLQVIDIRRAGDPQQEGLQLAIEETRKPMDLSTGPLFRAAVVRLEDEDHLLLITIHHIITDGWSMGVLTRELTTLYESLKAGRPSPLQPLAVQFGDYAVWQRKQLEGERLGQLVRFWKDTLEAHPFVLHLPTDHERPPLQGGRGLHHRFEITGELSDRLRQISQSENITLFALMLAVFYTLLGGMSAQDDLIVGTPIANRNQSDLEGLIGYFVNLLPLRARLHEAGTLVELARQVHQTTIQANMHQDLPFGKLVEELQPQRDPSRNPIFQVEFTLLDPSHAPPVYGYGFSSPVEQVLHFADLALTPLETESEASKFDLTVLLWDMPDGISGTFEYDAELFEPDTIIRMAEDYAALLTHVSSNPKIPPGSLKGIIADKVRMRNETARRERRSLSSKKIKAIRRKEIKG